MKSIIVLCILVAAVYSKPGETYDTRYDNNFDVEGLVGNVRLLKGYCHCFIGDGPCTPEGLDFRKIIPDALKTNCAKCTAQQRRMIRLVIHAFKDKTPDLWKQLVKKEDPNGEYTANLENFINSSD